MMINACNHITCTKAEAGRSLSLKPARTKKRFCVCVCGGRGGRLWNIPMITNTWEVGGHPQLHSEFEDNLNHTKALSP